MQDTAALAFTPLGLRLYGANWTNLLIRSYTAPTLHAPPLKPRPSRPPRNAVCFGARSASAVVPSLPVVAALGPAPGERERLHIAYPAALLPPWEVGVSIGSVSTQFVIEENANENVPGK